MSLPDVVSREDWLAARKELLVQEKAATQARDDLNADRRRLPMVQIEKDYVFEGPDGEASLVDLFEGRRQLIVDHYMFDPSWDDGCPSCAGRVYLFGLSDGACVALLAALERPDLVRRLVFNAGVFHHEGWAPGAIDLDDETVSFFIGYWGAVAPDGPEHSRS